MLARRGLEIPRLVLWGLVLILAVRLALSLPQDAVRPSHGFIAVYTTAQLLREGADASLTYDDDWFKAQIARFLPGIGDVNINPPTFALLGLPLTGLDYTGARVVWTLVSLVALIAAVGWIIYSLPLTGGWALLLVAYALIAQPVDANFFLGQIYLILLLLYVVTWQGFRNGRDGWLGLALGSMGIFKLAGITLWPLLVVRWRWRAILIGVGTMALVAVVSLPWLGWHAWQIYPYWVGRFNSDPSLAVTAYQTQLSLVWHLFTFDPQWNPTPLFPAPLLATWLPRLGVVLLVGLPLYLAYLARATRHSDDLIFAALVVANVIVGTATLDYHYALLLLPIAVLMAWARERRSLWVWLILGCAMWLIAADLPYRSPRLAVGAWALLAYPKLYGAWLLWGLAVWGCYEKQRVSRYRLARYP